MTDAHPSRFTMTRLLAGEISGAERVELKEHLNDCAHCTTAYAALESVQVQGEREAPPLKLPERRAARPHWYGLALAGASALVVFAAVLPHGGEIRSKGAGARVEFACKDGPRVWRCQSGERVRPGTAVAVRVELVSPRWLMLLGRDGSGRWRTYLPSGGEGAVLVAAGARDPLGASLVLDETPGEERFVLVMARRAFSRADLLPEDPDMVALRLTSDFQAFDLRLTK